MIPRIRPRTDNAAEPLAEALGQPVSPQDCLTERTVVAHWPGLDEYTRNDEQRAWTSAQWAEHLDDPFLEHPHAAPRYGDQRAIFHLHVRLHPDDRDLTGPEWAEIAHRLARAAGIETPGSIQRHRCRWIALQAQPGQLDLITNLIRRGGAWHTLPADIIRRVSDEARRIEQDLLLTPGSNTDSRRPAARPLPTARTQFAALLVQLADEKTGPLAAVRGLVEHTAQRITRESSASGAGMAHRLELITCRIHALQHDLDTTAQEMTQPRPTAAPATAHLTSSRSR